MRARDQFVPGKSVRSSYIPFLVLSDEVASRDFFFIRLVVLSSVNGKIKFHVALSEKGKGHLVRERKLNSILNEKNYFFGIFKISCKRD